jgi:hypothetical protein
MFACVCVCVYVWFAACWANCVVPVALDLVGATPTWQPSLVREIRYVWPVFIVYRIFVAQMGEARNAKQF